MRRIASYLFVGAVSAAAVGCQDSVLAPASQRVSPTSSAPSLSRSANPGRSDRTVITTLTISPSGGTYHVGDFDVVIPAGAVCDPQSTAYGAKHWDDDCVPANRDFTVSVVAETHKDQVSIDFKPDLRFRPSAGWVTIRTAAYSDLLTSDAVRQLPLTSSYFSNFAILYVPTGGQSRIDEVRSTGDPSLVTHVDLTSGMVWRRVKHFSGYVVYSGQKCDTSTPDATSCIVDDGSGAIGTVSGQTSTALITTLTLDTTSTSLSVIVTP
jgi:hypothetical protein